MEVFTTLAQFAIAAIEWLPATTVRAVSWLFSDSQSAARLWIGISILVPAAVALTALVRKHHRSRLHRTEVPAQRLPNEDRERTP